MPFSKNAPRDANAVPTALFESSTVPGQTLSGQIDQTTGRILVDASVSGSVIATHFQTDTFTATNNQTIFTASQSNPLYNMYVSENGAIQTPSSDYSTSTNTLTLSSGVPSGTIILWQYIY